MERTSGSGFPIDPVYDASKLTDFQPEAKLGRPGEYPFNRGVYPRVYVDRPPARLGFDSGAPAAHGEVGKLGVDGLRAFFDGSPPDAATFAICRAGLPRWNTISISGCHPAAAAAIVVGINKCAAGGTGNALYPPRDALRADVTFGEVCNALRDTWGEYHLSEM
jgi:methylmalonyl-CoA mutase N-terminal domain/subunit